jgi:uncharacterized protein (DUF433 family)
MNPIISAFTIDQAAKLTGLSEAQLRRWDRSGIYSPQHALENRRRPHSRIYSFKDLIGLRTLAQLRQSGVSVQRLRTLQEFFRDLPPADLWTGLSLYYDRPSGRFYFRHAGGFVATEPIGQMVMNVFVELEPILRDVSQRVQKLSERTPDEIGQISSDRYIHGGAPIIAGTRIPVVSVMGYVRDGTSPEEIVQLLPRLHLEDVSAAIDYAKEHGLAPTG